LDWNTIPPDEEVQAEIQQEVRKISERKKAVKKRRSSKDEKATEDAQIKGSKDKAPREKDRQREEAEGRKEVAEEEGKGATKGKPESMEEPPRTRRYRPSKPKYSSLRGNVRTMSLLKEEEEEREFSDGAQGGVTQSLVDLASFDRDDHPALGGEPAPINIDDNLPGHNFFFQLKQRRGSMPVSSSETLRSWAEVCSPVEFLKVHEKSGVPEFKGNWETPAPKKQSASAPLPSLMATNPLFDFNLLDLSHLPPEEQVEFKQRFGSQEGIVQD